MNLYLWLTLLSQITPTPEGELRLQKRLVLNHSEKRFDLSGLHIPSPALKKKLQIDADLLLVNDKTPTIYIGKIKGSDVTVTPWIELPKKKPDFEGIDGDDSSLFVVNEADASIFEIQSSTRYRSIARFESLAKRADDFRVTKEFGIESLAISPDWIVLGREKPPLALFVASRKTNIPDFNTKTRQRLGSQTGLRMEGSSIYILDREVRGVWKESFPGLIEQGFVSFRATVEKPENKFILVDRLGHKHPEWGSAEALELTENEIWIGLDNNAQVSLSGESRPLILVFDRPKDF